jgi:hypothetical protein
MYYKQQWGKGEAILLVLHPPSSAAHLQGKSWGPVFDKGMQVWTECVYLFVYLCTCVLVYLCTCVLVYLCVVIHVLNHGIQIIPNPHFSTVCFV